MFDQPMAKWLTWAREIQGLSQTGLAFACTDYEVQRYRRLYEIAAEIIEVHAGLPQAELVENFSAQPGYATVKVDVRGAVALEGKILLVQEARDKKWCMPGGWADVGDKPSDMVAREVREESGLEVTPRKIVAVYDANRGGRPMELYHAYKIIFLCDISGGTVHAQDETIDAGFFSFDELPPLSSQRTSEKHLAEVKAHLEDENRPAAFD